MSRRVGIIGAGLMGLPMSSNWISQGWEVMGFDVDPARRALLAAAGAKVASDIAQVTDFAAFIVVSLPSSAALDTVVEELVRITHREHVIAETSTLAISEKERAAQQFANGSGATLLDCPLIGGAVQAKNATLTVLASGDEAACRVIEPLFAATSRQYRYVGSFGTASRLKFIINHLVGTSTVLIAETMQFAKRAGLDLVLVDDIVRNSPASSGIWQARVPLMLSGIYDDPETKAADLAIPFKDTRIIADFIAQHSAVTPLFDAALDIYRVAQEQDRAHQDAAALFEVFETLNAQHGGLPQ